MSGLSRDEISRIIYDNGLFHGRVSIGIVMDLNHLERFANLVAAAERGVCIKICEEVGYEREGGWTCADLIRARGSDAT